jgi:hypothetical protein
MGFLCIFLLIRLFILELLPVYVVVLPDKMMKPGRLVFWGSLSEDNIAYSGKELILFSGLSREREGDLTPFPI